MIDRIGIIGGGQLGRMLTQAALPLGFQVTVLDPNEGCPAAQVGATQIVGALDDTSCISELSRASDVVTWEIEHIPTEPLVDLTAAGARVEPSPETLAVIQDKLLQKELLVANGIPTAPFRSVDDGQLAGPFVVKARKGGFDGRGNLSVEVIDAAQIHDRFPDQETYIEQRVPFEAELAVVAARDTSGRILTYPVVKTVHVNNICHMVDMPASVPDEVLQAASALAHKTLQLFHGAGVFCIEMFLVDGELLINEIAPRVHNAGHLTIEACATSQFEQHIRAVSGMPLGSVEPRVPVATMINILGTRDEPLGREGVDTVLGLPDTHLHLYGKRPRPGRKVGHITIVGSSADEARETAVRARKALAI